MSRKSIMKIAAAVIAATAVMGVSVNAMSMGKSYYAVKVSPEKIEGCVKESGKVHGETDKIYYSTVTAPITTVAVREGDKVEKGDLLVSYDESDLVRNLEEADIKTEQAVLDYSGNVKKSDDYARKYNKAVSDDSTYAMMYWIYREKGNEISEEEFKRQYMVQCQIDAVNREIADKEKEISEKQHDKNKAGSYGTKESDDYTQKDVKKLKKAQKEIDRLNTELSELKKQLYIDASALTTPKENEAANDVNNMLEDINRNWTETKNDRANYENLILNDDEKEALKKNTELSRKEAEGISENLVKAKNGIKSDFSGIVTSIDVQDGAYVTEGTPLFTVENTENLVCRVDISRYDISKIKKGQRAKIDIAGQIYDGEVSKIKAIAKEDASDKSKIEVDVSVKGADDMAILDIEADVTIYTDSRENALTIPVEAFYTDAAGDYCYLIENGRIAKKYLTAGINNGDKVEIVSGLSKDDIVLTDAVTDDKIGEKANYVLN